MLSNISSIGSTLLLSILISYFSGLLILKLLDIRFYDSDGKLLPLPLLNLLQSPLPKLHTTNVLLAFYKLSKWKYLIYTLKNIVMGYDWVELITRLFYNLFLESSKSNIIGLSLFGYRFIILGDPEFVKIVLSSNDQNFVNLLNSSLYHQIVGDIPIQTYSHVVHPMIFPVTSLRLITKISIQHILTCIKKWSNALSSAQLKNNIYDNHSDSNNMKDTFSRQNSTTIFTHVDLFEDIRQVIIEIMCQASFGVNISLLSSSVVSSFLLSSTSYEEDVKNNSKTQKSYKFNKYSCEEDIINDIKILTNVNNGNYYPIIDTNSSKSFIHRYFMGKPKHEKNENKINDLKSAKRIHTLIDQIITYRSEIKQMILSSSSESISNNYNNNNNNSSSYRNNLYKKEDDVEYDLLSIILQQAIENSFENIDFNQNKQIYSVKNVRDQLLLFLLSGIQPLSHLITWVIIELCNNDDMQLRCHEEVDNINYQNYNASQSSYSYQSPNGIQFPSNINNSDYNITLDDCSKYEFLTLVIRETLRLHPPQEIIVKQSTQMTQFNNFRVNPPASIILDIHSIHTHSDYWYLPNEFLPDRFNRMNIDDTLKHSHQYIPLKGIPLHSCLDENFIISQSIVILSILLSNFQFKLSDSSNMNMNINGVNGLRNNHHDVKNRHDNIKHKNVNLNSYFDGCDNDKIIKSKIKIIKRNSS
eukprot:gene6571-9032_t